MKTNRQSKKIIIRESYVRLVLVNVFVLMATSMCGFIDIIVISRMLVPKALAATGFFAPLAHVCCASAVLINGTVILCGSFIGAGEQHRVNSLFTSAFIALGAVFLAITLIFIIFRYDLAVLLGASEETAQFFADYTAGFSPSIMIGSLSAMLFSLASFNNQIYRSYIATAAMFVGNIVLDIVLAEPLGLFGIGLASTFSALISLIIMLPAFTGDFRAVHFSFGKFATKDVLEASRRGLPALLFTAGMVIKYSAMNHAINTNVGEDGVAVVNVMAQVCGIVGTLVGGFTSSQQTMDSLFYGEEDREGYIDVYHLAMRLGLTCTTILIAAMALCSTPLSHVFFKPDTFAATLCKRMFTIGFWFFLLNLVFNLYMNSYKIFGKMKLVNVLAFLETAMIGVIAELTIPGFGPDAAWLANAWSDVIGLAILVISVFIWKKKVCLTAPALLKMPDDFGALPEQFVEYAVKDKEEVSTVSEAVMDFCRSKGIDRKKTYWTGLCVEEVARNIFEHGSFREKKNQVNVRVVCKDELTIRVSDDCRKFDPREYLNLFDEETPEKAIGLRMVARLASNIDYYNNAGINTLIIKI